MPILPVNMTNPRKIGQIAQIFAEGQIRNQELQVSLLKQRQEQEALSQVAKLYQDETAKATKPDEVMNAFGKTAFGLMKFGQKAQPMMNWLEKDASLRMRSLEPKEAKTYAPNYRDYLVTIGGKRQTRSLTPEEVNAYANQGVDVTPVPVVTATMSQLGQEKRQQESIGLRTKEDVLKYVADNEDTIRKLKRERADYNILKAGATSTPEEKTAAEDAQKIIDEQIADYEGRITSQRSAHPDYFSSGTTMMSKSAFIKDFESDQKRKPTEAEIQRAKNKFWK